MKLILFLIAFHWVLLVTLSAQDSVQYRVLLIGDAGKKSREQQAVMQDAIQHQLRGKTIALFLGDNIYPRGMELTGSKLQQHTREILQSQYQGLRMAGVPVYFIPGNHDWDKSGPNGYKKIMELNSWLRQQNDSLLQLMPVDACPGPTELVLNENLVIVAMDSEWWLYPFNLNTDGADDCECKTKREVLGKLSDILLRHREKVVLFATHHPFTTYGSHGGYYNLKDHLFPLTNLNKKLYLPLPVIGSLYPLLRRTFPPAEDGKNILYRDMKKNVDEVLKLHPNILHVAGHEHSIQLIQGAVLELVSGAGAKKTPVKMGKGSLFADASSGYVVADILRNNTIRLTVRKYRQGIMENAFVYDKPATAIPVMDETVATMAVQGDSISIPLNPGFDSVSGVHRKLFGENYRKLWAMKTSMPIFQLSNTGLLPTEAGGGMQTRSLRLMEGKKEWVLRSVEKFPDILLPQSLTNTLAADIIRDNVTASFPFAPLTLPVFANAAGVPHSDPKLVYIAPDKNLGIYGKDFANTIALLEEREPMGKSISTIKMVAKLKDDNDHQVDQAAFLRARILDIFLGDWDRHADQWRWIEVGKGKSKLYAPVPRDRDQVFYINQGLFPKIAALPWITPKLQGFGPGIKNINTFSMNAALIDGIFTNRLNIDDWKSITAATLQALTDSVIEAALKRMPTGVYAATHLKLAAQLQQRRADLLLKAPTYYTFINKVIDITASGKNEKVIIRDTLDGQLGIHMYKIQKDGEIENLLYQRVIDPSVTKEIRLYLFAGKDEVLIQNNSAPVKIRIVGDALAPKKYSFSGKNQYLRKIHIYEGTGNTEMTGAVAAVNKHLSNDASNTELILTNRYNKTIPLLKAGFNIDDGFIIGAGIKWIRQGFRKQPFAAIQQFSLAHSFSSGAYRFMYSGEWLHAIGKTDFLLQANIFAPDNTQNFFGRGNETPISKTGDYLRFYRTRFSLYSLGSAFRWRSGKANSISLSPAIQYYRYDADDNKGRFINNTAQIHSYDSATISNEKVHAGIVLNFLRDNRNNVLLPSFGSYINMRVQGFAGLNDYSKSFGQITTELAVYKSIDRKSNLVIANRLGGGITTGKATFYQSLFLGGHENLWGYHQYRFAGEHMLFNNLEARLKLANLASYILPGQLGIIGFFDVGKVWQKGYNTARWHTGAGGGLYFAPAQMAVFQLVAGNSGEGWYPYFTMGFRF